ncbi:hypothetical protein NHX12_025632, partial [Muraenolepis orangiensis]
MLEVLLSLGAQPNTQDLLGRTPAMLAAKEGFAHVLTLLAENHADMNLTDNEGKGGAASRCGGEQRVCGRLLRPPAELSEHPACNTTSLHLLERGADPNIANQSTGVSALMLAAQRGSLQLVRALLQRGGLPGARDAKQQNAIHYAAMGGFFQ